MAGFFIQDFYIRPEYKRHRVRSSRSGLIYQSLDELRVYTLAVSFLFWAFADGDAGSENGTLRIFLREFRNYGSPGCRKPKKEGCDAKPR